MPRSLGFGSNECYWVALFRLAFATAPYHPVLNLATPINSPVHSTKGTRLACYPVILTALEQDRPSTGCRHMVSGTISLPLSGYFSPFPHGTSSLSVANEYLALGSGLPGFPQGSTCPVVLEDIIRELLIFRLPDYHRLW